MGIEIIDTEIIDIGDGFFWRKETVRFAFSKEDRPELCTKNTPIYTMDLKGKLIEGTSIEEGL